MHLFDTDQIAKKCEIADCRIRVKSQNAPSEVLTLYKKEKKKKETGGKVKRAETA